MKTDIRNRLLLAIFFAAFTLLTYSRCAAQNLFVTYTFGFNAGIYEYTQAGAQSSFASGMTNPVPIAIDINGNVYVDDLIGGEIFKYTPAGVRTNFAVGLYTYLAVDSLGTVYGVLGYGANNTIYKFNSSGVRSTFVSGLVNPAGIVCDSLNNLYVALGDGTVMEFDSNGNPVNPPGPYASGMGTGPHLLAFNNSSGELFATEPSSGTLYEIPQGGGSANAIETGLSNPDGVACDSAGNVYVAVSGAILETNLVAQTGGTFASGQFIGNTQLAFPPCHAPPPISAQNMFVTFTLSSGFCGILEETPTSLQNNFGLWRGGNPVPIAIDGAKNVFVCDLNAKVIYKFLPFGSRSTFASGTYNYLAADSAGNLYAGASDSQNGTIEKYTPSGVGNPFGPSLVNPAGMVCDPAGNLYVEVGNGDVEEFSSGGSLISATYGTGMNPYNGGDHRLAFNSSGDLFVTESSSGTVWEIPPGGGQAKVFVQGLNDPDGLACDVAGTVFVVVPGAILDFSPDGLTQGTYVTDSAFNSGTQLAMQSALSPYGVGTFSSFDPETQTPVPFLNSLAYYGSNQAVYAVSGPTNSGPTYGNDVWAYGLVSNLGPTDIFTNFIESGVGFDSDSWMPTPAISTNGTVYVVTPAGTLSAFNTNGALQWTYFGILEDGFRGRASPSIGLDGNIYVATDDGGGVLYCIDPDLGLSKWKLRLSDATDMDASPLCTTNGIYDVDELGSNHFITYLGQEYPPLLVGSSFPSSSPAMTPDGFLWVGNNSGLQIVDPVAQKIVQTIPLTGSISASPVVGPDGVVYVGTTGGDFFAISQPNTNVTARIIAKISLGSANFLTTATIGKDSRIYLGSSAGSSGTAPGSLFSMHLQTLCGGPLPYQFVLDWQTNVTDGGFLGSPLLAQTYTGSIFGNPNSLDVVYAGNADGNIYALLASAGPSSNTWSTFQGNAQRQGNWNPSNQTVRRPELWSIQFGPSGQLNQTGKAAYGNSSSDHWNSGVVGNNVSQVSFSSVETYTNAGFPLTIASASGSSDFSGADVPQTDDPFNDNLMTNLMFSPNSFTLNISGLPITPFTGNGGTTALYDVYVYAYGGRMGDNSINAMITLSPGATNPVTGNFISPSTPLTTTNIAIHDLSHFNENFEYVVFRDVPVTSQSGPQIQITVAADPNNPGVSIPLINGIQIVAKQ